MSQLSAPFQLAQLDEYRPAMLDPAVWSANLDALSTEQPDWAGELRRVALPPAWRPALALDESVTFRLEEPGQPPAWLGQSAAPATRAQSLLGKFDPTGRNPALACCGAGAELSCLLDKLPPHVAVFVFESDPRALAAMLRTCDWSTAIRQGRCILVPSGREEQFLAECLERYPGLLPPGDILLPDLISPSRLQELRGICERVMSDTLQRRNELLDGLDSAAGSAPPSPTLAGPHPRLAVLSLNPHPPAHAVAAGLERAGQALDWEVVCRAVRGPRDVHALVHCQAFATFKPDLTICINHPRSRLPMALPGVTCVWALDETGAVVDRSPAVLYLAASPRVATALRQAGVSADTLLDWYWACETFAEVPQTAPPDATVILVGDLPDPRPESYGIEHAAHRKLWEHLRVTAARVWEAPRVLEPEKLLIRAERECQVNLPDPDLRQSLVRLIEQVLVPAVILEHIAGALASEPVQVRTLGRGWERLAGGNLEPLAADWSELSGRGLVLHPRAAVFAGGREPLGAALLYAAAQGWPLLLHSPGGQPLVHVLGDVLRPGQHFEAFADRTGLHRALELLSEPSTATQRRVARARQHVAEQHSYVRRLSDLLAHVQKAVARRTR